MLIKESISILQTPETIWRYWLDVANDVNWRNGIIKGDWTSPPPYGVGSTGEDTHEQMGSIKWEVTQFQDGRSFEFIHTAGPLKGSIAFFQVDPDGDGSRVQIRVRLTGPFLMRIMLLFMGGKVRSGLRGDFQRLKQIMEQ